MEFERISLSANKTDEKSTLAAYTDAVRLLSEKCLTVATAESCTGGLMGKLFTDISGASAVFCGGMITYTNHIKINKLGVSAETVEKYTEVSAKCAAEMAQRAREYFEADIGISATGFAGPTGGNETDPVGTVYLGISTAEKLCVYRLSFKDCTREEIRLGTAKIAAQKTICV